MPTAVPGTKDLIVRLNLENDLGFDIAFRPSGVKMGKVLGFPKFERWRRR